MNAQDAIVPFTALLMLGLIWIRTRIQYRASASGPVKVQTAGRVYFLAAAALLALGWFVAPALGSLFWAPAGATPTLMRVIWCLAAYYLFILVHRLMKSRGVRVFA